MDPTTTDRMERALAPQRRIAALNKKLEAYDALVEAADNVLVKVLLNMSNQAFAHGEDKPYRDALEAALALAKEA